MLNQSVRDVLSLSEARKICREGLKRTIYVGGDDAAETLEVEGFDESTLEFRFFYRSKTDSWKLDKCCLMDLATLSEYYDLDDHSKGIIWREI